MPTPNIILEIKIYDKLTTDERNKAMEIIREVLDKHYEYVLDIKGYSVKI